MTEIVRIKVSLVLTLESVESSSLFISTGVCSAAVKIQQSAGKMSVSRTGGQEEPCLQTHTCKFCLILAVRTSLGSCKTRVNVDHCVPRTPVWPPELLEQVSQKGGCTCARPPALPACDTGSAAWRRAAGLTCCLARKHQGCLAKKKKGSQDLVHVVCKCFCVETWGEDLWVLHPSTATSWDSEHAVLQRGLKHHFFLFSWNFSV